VQDLHGHAGTPADLDRLADGLEDAGPLVAHVGHEDAAVTGHHLAQLDQVVGGRQRVRRHGQGARQAAGALLHRLFDQGLHLP
jgi:hypothetical protein